MYKLHLEFAFGVDVAIHSTTTPSVTPRPIVPRSVLARVGEGERGGGSVKIQEVYSPNVKIT